ncbi:MAG: DUF4345 domain-containing protein [Flavobacteriales bacterium]|nr:DUF4345 domain-containing protein [Flavobacteriales bacterium]
MLLTIRIILGIYGLIAIGTGLMGATASYKVAASNPMQDNNHRFVAAIWASMSLAFFYTAWNPSEVALFRFLMVAVFIGGLVRTYGLRFYPATPFIIFGILVELLPTTILLWMHTKLMNAGSL